MSQKSSLYRTIEILKDLNNGKKLCITNLATAYEVSDRTIRRDFWGFCNERGGVLSSVSQGTARGCVECYRSDDIGKYSQSFWYD